MSSRADGVVILARGASQRMGRPKGLLPCPGRESQTFLEVIAQSYVELDFPVLVITTPDLVADHRQLVAHTGRCEVVGHLGGGETARTVELALRALDSRLTHLWAHPIDLPLVTKTTLEELENHSRQRPASLVRPKYQGVPGHPVICPVGGLIPLRGHGIWQNAPMREVIAMCLELGHIEKSVQVPVQDVGVVNDFDTPNDLKRLGHEPLAEDPDGNA